MYFVIMIIMIILIIIIIIIIILIGMIITIITARCGLSYHCHQNFDENHEPFRLMIMTMAPYVDVH